jgi:putative hydrolase of the HAD superfamily
MPANKGMKAGLKKPKAIIFDTDNTLYPYATPHEMATKAVDAKAVELLGVSQAKFKEVYAEARRQTKSRLGQTASSHSRLLYLQRTIELIGLRTQILLTLDLEQTYWRTFLSNCRLFPEVRDFLVDVKSDGVTTAIITDLTAQIQFRKIVYFGLDTYFDFVVTSEEAGFDKPHPAAFQMALEKLQLPGNEVWMIGDDPVADIEGANGQNLVTLQKIHDGVVVRSCGAGLPAIKFHDFSSLRKLWQSL